MLVQWIAGLPAFLAYFCLSVVAVILYLVIYMAITPHREFDLIRNDKPGAALSLGLSMLASRCRWRAPWRMPAISSNARSGA